MGESSNDDQRVKAMCRMVWKDDWQGLESYLKAGQAIMIEARNSEDMGINSKKMQPKRTQSAPLGFIHTLAQEFRSFQEDKPEAAEPTNVSPSPAVSPDTDDTLSNTDFLPGSLAKSGGRYEKVPLIDGKYRGCTPLILAAQLGRTNCVKVLLEHWADTLTASSMGYYPLQEAVSRGDRELIRMILLRRHEQWRQIWKIRQPDLSNALHTELPDFSLEMKWHFRSWIPFVARFCPSDTCKIWKRGNKLRVDSTLMGVQMDTLSSIKGNISFIFHVNDANSRMLVLDHDRKLYEEIDKTLDFTEEEIEEDVNIRLNTQIYYGKVKKPPGGVEFQRQQAGLFGLGGDREETIGPYKTRVYDVPDLEVIARYRNEHLRAREKMVMATAASGAMAATENNSNGDIESESPSFSLDSDAVLKDLEDEQNIDVMIQETRKKILIHVPSLPPPRDPPITEAEYFNEGSSEMEEDARLSYAHVGRPMAETKKSKRFKMSVWMADNFPLTVRQLLPFFEIMTLGNKNFEKLREFISMDLPPGFPVQIEIPLFAFLSAQITFLNFISWEAEGVVPAPPAFGRGDEKSWFEIPSDYAEGIVLKNILKD